MIIVNSKSIIFQIYATIITTLNIKFNKLNLNITLGVFRGNLRFYLLIKKGILYY